MKAFQFGLLMIKESFSGYGEGSGEGFSSGFGLGLGCGCGDCDGYDFGKHYYSGEW